MGTNICRKTNDKTYSNLKHRMETNVSPKTKKRSTHFILKYWMGADVSPKNNERTHFI